MHSKKDLRKQGKATLNKEAVATRFLINKLKLMVVSWKEKASHKVANAKKYLARILTIANEKA